MNPPKITKQNIKEARKVFEQNEPRNLFYKVSIILVKLSFKRKIKLTPSESLGVLLQTWNRVYYRFRKFDESHYCKIERLLKNNLESLHKYRKLKIENLGDKDKQKIKRIFKDFENILGPVGAAKSLHLIAPSVFPLWDRSIATAYNTPLKKTGTNSDNYIQFLLKTKQQVKRLLQSGVERKNLLKRIDEYNYCKYTKGWI